MFPGDFKISVDIEIIMDYRRPKTTFVWSFKSKQRVPKSAKETSPHLLIYRFFFNPPPIVPYLEPPHLLVCINSNCLILYKWWYTYDVHFEGEWGGGMAKMRYYRT